MYIYLFICIHTHMCTYVHTYTHIHICHYIYVSAPSIASGYMCEKSGVGTRGLPHGASPPYGHPFICIWQAHMQCI